MYVVSAQPLNLSYGFGNSLEARRHIYWGCHNSRISKNVRQEEDVPFMTYHRICWKDKTNAVTKVNLINLPKASSGNTDLNEIKYGLEMPLYATLPGVEARFLIEHYSINELWIGKSLYRMPDLNGDANLELAKFDYNRCQAQHQIEWNHMQQWYEDENVEEFGISKKDVLVAYFLAAATIFMAERSPERLAWAKSQIVFSVLSAYYSIKESEPSDQMVEFSTPFGVKVRVDQATKGYKNIRKIITVLFETLHQLKKDAKEQIGGDDGDDLLHEAWGGWLKKQGERAEKSEEIEVVIRTINICAGNIVSKEILSHNEYTTLSSLTNNICNRLSEIENEEVHLRRKILEEVDKEMQVLMQLVLKGSSNGISEGLKQTFLAFAKTFYYRAYCPTQQIESHMAKVLFEPVV